MSLCYPFDTLFLFQAFDFLGECLKSLLDLYHPALITGYLFKMMHRRDGFLQLTPYDLMINLLGYFHHGLGELLSLTRVCLGGIINRMVKAVIKVLLVRRLRAEQEVQLPLELLQARGNLPVKPRLQLPAEMAQLLVDGHVELFDPIVHFSKHLPVLLMLLLIFAICTRCSCAQVERFSA